MESNSAVSPEKKSVRALEATNFFLADVRTGLGPFLAAYLAGAGWEPGHVGMALTTGGIIAVTLQVPAGAIVDQLRSKRLILVIASAVLAFGAVLLRSTAAPWAVYTSEVLIGRAGPFLGPMLVAVTMGIVGVIFFDRQFAKNRSFNPCWQWSPTERVPLAGSNWFKTAWQPQLDLAQLSVPPSEEN